MTCTRTGGKMFRKLFGETEQDQIQFLHPRAIATLVILALMVVALILHAVGLSGGADAIAGIAEMGVAIVLLFVAKGLFGITAIGAIFSGNVVIGVVLFVVYLTLAYFLGIIFAFIGTIRYIYLRIKYGKINERI